MCGNYWSLCTLESVLCNEKSPQWEACTPQLEKACTQQQTQSSQKINDVVFPVVMYGCESWTIKKAEHWRIDAFELWCWRRLLRVPWTARRSNQSILREISPKYSLEGLMLKLNLQYFGHLMRKTNSLEMTWCWEGLKAGGEGDDRGWNGWMASPTQWTWVWANSKSGDGQGSLACCSPWRSKESDTTEWLNWIELNCYQTTHWKRLWCWEGLGAGGEGDDRGWDTWMASLLKLMSIESVMPSNHLILCRPLLLSPSIFPRIRVFSNELAPHLK